ETFTTSGGHVNRNAVPHAGKRLYSRWNWKRVTGCSLLLLIIIATPRPVTHAQAATPPLYGVKKERVWIPMKDGVRLAADLFMPMGGKPGEKFPAVFKYDPYRKDDNDSIFSECDINKYFVSHGYVGACVDIRGTGRSEGHVPDREYSAQELS